MPQICSIPACFIVCYTSATRSATLCASPMPRLFSVSPSSKKSRRKIVLPIVITASMFGVGTPTTLPRFYQSISPSEISSVK